MAASFTNVNMAKTKWKFPSGVEDDVTITSHVYAGASYTTAIDANKFVYGKSKLIDKDSRSIDFLFQFQYINFVNMRLTEDDHVPHNKQNIRWGGSAGAEILFLKFVALRFGYRYEKRGGEGGAFGSSNSGSYPYVKGFTFGTGLNVPLRRLTDSKLPFDLSVDYVHRNKPFKWLKENNVIEELPTSNINLRMNWYLK